MKSSPHGQNTPRGRRAIAEEAAVLDVVDALYASAVRNESWTFALTPVSELFGAVGVSFEIFDTKIETPVVFDVTPDMPLPPRQEYMEYYAGLSPRFQFGLGKPTGTITYDNMILSDAEMDKNEFYADCIAPIGLRYFIAAHVLSTDSHMAVFAAQRTKTQGHVTPREIALMQRLAPHLRRAADVKFRLSAARPHAAQNADGLDLLAEGCAAVTQAGNVARANARAQSIFAAGDGVSLTGDRLVFTDKTAAKRYEQCLGETAGDFPARRPSGKRPYLVSIRPLPAATDFWREVDYGAALVFIRDTEDFIRLDRRLLADTFKLSEAEADIAAALDNGLTIPQVARDRDVSITTVRSQLYALMAKLGVRRQNELIRLLAQYRLPFA